MSHSKQLMPEYRDIAEFLVELGLRRRPAGPLPKRGTKPRQSRQAPEPTHSTGPDVAERPAAAAPAEEEPFLPRFDKPTAPAAREQSPKPEPLFPQLDEPPAPAPPDPAPPAPPKSAPAEAEGVVARNVDNVVGFFGQVDWTGAQKASVQMPESLDRRSSRPLTPSAQRQMAAKSAQTGDANTETTAGFFAAVDWTGNVVTTASAPATQATPLTSSARPQRASSAAATPPDKQQTVAQFLASAAWPGASTAASNLAEESVAVSGNGRQ